MLSIVSESALQKEIPKLTATLFTIPLESGRYLIYAPLRRTAFVANAKVINFLADLREGCYAPEADSDGSLVEFLQQLKILDAEPEKLPISQFSGDPMPVSLTLFLTTACNLRCTYCYASAGDTPLRSMSLEIAKRGIDFVIANAVKKKVPRVKISYHGGGEPTTNWKVMTDSFEYAREKAARLGLSVDASTASNGVLSDDRIDWLVANFIGVNLSFDGVPQAHDTHRPTVTGEGSSDRVIHTIRRFDEMGFNYGIRMTVTDAQISHLPDSVEFICANFHPQSIQVEPAYQLGRWSDAPSAETEEFIAAYRKAQERAIYYGYELHYSAARLDSLTNHFCGISQDSFALSADGNVSACYEVFSETNSLADIFFYGKPSEKDSGYVFDLQKLNNLRQQAVQNREFCRDCFAKWHCAGDCYHKSLATNGRGEFVGSDRCHVTRELIKDRLLARIVEAGGLYWHAPLSE